MISFADGHAIFFGASVSNPNQVPSIIKPSARTIDSVTTIIVRVMHPMTRERSRQYQVDKPGLDFRCRHGPIEIASAVSEPITDR
jgi:hypothetical protein